jgi:predicted GIY-YIG superfamily endonuclease
MFYVYILKSDAQKGAIYIGQTIDLKKRLIKHNSRQSAYSKKYAPWSLETYLAFTELSDAKKFETYLKSNSGKAFMHKRLISKEFRGAVSEFNNGRKVKPSISEV